MDVLMIMGLGVLAGRFLIPNRTKKGNEIISLTCTFLLIFSMGVTLGRNDNFFERFIFFGAVKFIVLFSSNCLVYSHRFYSNKKINDKENYETRKRGRRMIVLFMICALVIGLLYGMSGIDFTFLNIISENTDLVLYILMFSVGISIGMQRGILSKIKEYHLKIFIIPIGIIIGSFLGGVICSLILKMPIGYGTAITSGLGWYSLAGVTISSLANVELGSIAFMSNLMREMFSFILIPFLAVRLNYYTCIASAAATSEDTTLPLILKYTNEETVVLSVFNGVICSLMVPILISSCLNML